jgi:hypothetical protein
MKRILYTISSAVLAFPMLTSAQGLFGNTNTVQGFFEELVRIINGVLIPFIIALGFLAFVWGMFKFFIWGGHDEEAKEAGKSLMIWATVGFVLIIVFWGLINLLSRAVGLQGEKLENIPSVPKVDITKTLNPS